MTFSLLQNKTLQRFIVHGYWFIKVYQRAFVGSQERGGSTVDTHWRGRRKFDYLLRRVMEWLFDCFSAPSFLCQDGCLASPGCRLFRFSDLSSLKFEKGGPFLISSPTGWEYRERLSIKMFIRWKAVKERCGPPIGMWVACQSIWAVIKKR